MDCIFCDIVRRKASAKIVYEDKNFIAIENIKPQAPVHILVMPKKHFDKSDMIRGTRKGFWDELIGACYNVIKKFGLDKTGYRLVLNGAGYQGVDHEHIHVLGGKGFRPSDNL